MSDWTTANKNPDGSKNKFKSALKDLPRSVILVCNIMASLFGIESWK